MTITEALAPAFVAAMGMQHLVELFAPKLPSAPGKKKWIIGIAAFVVSGALCWYAEPLRVIARVMQADPPKAAEPTKQDQKNDAKKNQTATTATSDTGAATGTTATTETTATATTGTADTTPPYPPPPFPAWVDVVVSAGIISAGTDGFNSILKFLGYKKEEAKDKSAAGQDLAKAA